jgi:outer membrane biosynthesis protein TonB
MHNKQLGSALPDAIPSINNEHPVYPEMERIHDAEASCLIQFHIQSDGSTAHIQNLSPHTCPSSFFDSARETMKKWRFKRTCTSVLTQMIPIHFSLH